MDSSGWLLHVWQHYQAAPADCACRMDLATTESTLPLACRVLVLRRQAFSAGSVKSWTHSWLSGHINMVSKAHALKGPWRTSTVC